MTKAGQDAPKTFEQQLEAISAELVDLLGRKNRGYGNSHDRQLDQYGEVATVIRLDDKLSRLRSLVIDGVPDEVGESIDDTLLDICGYSLLLLRYLRNGSIDA
ncbi:DUF1599 domain-containing protein [Listeria booriae]|nr:DUF1599 domain-containing protein [Listeria booriae]